MIVEKQGMWMCDVCGFLLGDIPHNEKPLNCDCGGGLNGASRLLRVRDLQDLDHYANPDHVVCLTIYSRDYDRNGESITRVLLSQHGFIDTREDLRALARRLSLRR